MSYNWHAILGGLLGGVLAALVAGYATSQMLPATTEVAISDMVWAGVAAAVGGVLGVVAGWLVNRRRGNGLGGIAAIVSLLAALNGTFSWFREFGGLYDVLPLLTRTILLLGGGLILMTLVCGLTAALLRVQSVPQEQAQL
ncbi:MULTISPECIES: hypothetical protein [unclassified Serinicoccus]|uniref:hypothetical protein n=1 Tax=unclassified Serinicoccus TaxID=2643101 RepID=UPI003854049D